MKFYLTGGALRDKLLGLRPRDQDYIIVDASKKELLDLGYIPVGKDFEVYLHPITKDEYTMALDNSIHKELGRRDLTINSIAYNEVTKEYIDPFNGLKDIKKKILKHTSNCFADDPIRILRLARFQAQYPDFSLAPATKKLCMDLSKVKDLFTLIQGERFLLEFQKALSLTNPLPFFEHLREWGTLSLFFSELSDLSDVPQREDYHPEGDCWVHTMLVLEQAVRLSENFSIRFASLVHDLGKAITPKEILPSHFSHEVNGAPLVEDVCNRFRVDSYTKKLSLVVCKSHLLVHKVLELKPSTIHDLIVTLNGFREEKLLNDALLCCMADARGRGENHRNKEYPQRDLILKMAKELKVMDITALKEKYEGNKLGDMIRQRRIASIKRIKNS